MKPVAASVVLLLAAASLVLAPVTSRPSAARAVDRQSAQSAGGPQSEKKAEVAGKNGVTRPRVVHQVNPRYTAEALQRHIQGSVIVECVVLEDGSVGSVRVVRSLDPKHGLDDEAVIAAKQWEFQPATKDDVPVPALISIELTFSLGARPTPKPIPFAWPAAFPADGKAAEDTEAWTTTALEEDGLRVRFAYPAGWTLRTDGPPLNWCDFVSEDYTRLVIVSQPVRSEGKALLRWTPSQLETDEYFRSEAYRKSGSKAVAHGTGQVKAAGLLWNWNDYSAPAGDPEVAPRVRSRAFGNQGQVRIWHFYAKTGRHLVAVLFRVAHGDDTAETNERIERDAAAQFAVIFAKLSFKER